MLAVLLNIDKRWPQAATLFQHRADSMRSQVITLDKFISQSAASTTC